MDGWWLHSWRTLWPSPWIDPVLAVVAVVCGILVGSERQRQEKPAGLRTHSLVCLGSAVFTMLSFVFTSSTGDSGRVSAQIVTGIGFLGAGVILHGQRTVSGLSTAAAIWVMAAIGMAVGAGFPIAGLALSLLVNRVMAGFFMYETRWHPGLRNVCMVLEYGAQGGITRIRLERVLADYNVRAASAVWSHPAPETGRLTLTMRLGRVHLFELLTELCDVSGVHSIQEQERPETAPPLS